MSVTLRPCRNDDPAFLQLVAQLDAFLAVTDGEEHGFYDQFNGSDTLDYAVVLECDEKAVGCGGLRQKGGGDFEIKRMYVVEEARGERLAVTLLRHLEEEARVRGGERTVLETGLRQNAAVRLYGREGYARVPNYPPYERMANSACFARPLIGLG